MLKYGTTALKNLFRYTKDDISKPTSICLQAKLWEGVKTLDMVDLFFSSTLPPLPALIFVCKLVFRVEKAQEKDRMTGSLDKFELVKGWIGFNVSLTPKRRTHTQKIWGNSKEATLWMNSWTQIPKVNLASTEHSSKNLTLIKYSLLHPMVKIITATCTKAQVMFRISFSSLTPSFCKAGELQPINKQRQLFDEKEISFLIPQNF